MTPLFPHLLLTADCPACGALSEDPCKRPAYLPPHPIRQFKSLENTLPRPARVPVPEREKGVTTDRGPELSGSERGNKAHGQGLSPNHAPALSGISAIRRLWK